jgi:hypothetical protein
MWFRRTRKADSDNELTETLRSLQTLLDDEPTRQRGENSLPPEPPENPELHVADPSPGETAHSVVSDEHLTWDFDVDLSTEELAGTAADSPGDESLELLDDGEITIRDKPDATAIDTIPVLNNVVFMPTAASSPRSGAHSAHAPTPPLVDLCIDDFNNRLAQLALPALDPSKEKRLRTFLMSLLDKKT